MDKVIQKLISIEGLGNVFRLSNADKKKIIGIELKNNHGVLEAVKRDTTIVLTHDSSFRKPAAQIVSKKKDDIVFPPVPFPEVEMPDVVSSSPSQKVHEFLVNRFNLRLDKGEATLLIGYNKND